MHKEMVKGSGVVKVIGKGLCKLAETNDLKDAEMFLCGTLVGDTCDTSVNVHKM